MTTTSIQHTRAPHNQLHAWERWWSGVTGAPGEIVWNAAESDLAADLEVFAEAFDRDLPVIDLGCGDGVLSEQIAAAGAQVVAVDAGPDMVAWPTPQSSLHSPKY